MKILVTGGCGFIGSALVNFIIKELEAEVINLDALTYAANPFGLKDVEASKSYTFVHGNILDGSLVRRVFEDHKPDYVIHLAAESHVDRSIDSAMEFVQTNVVGTVNLLNEARIYYNSLKENQKASFRFLHVSTDEVYGSLGDEGLFMETTPYDPRSPYSASKASSDHFVSAFYHTYGLPIFITNCSNNYGPNQFPEKLIPLTILKCLNEMEIPVYGEGKNIRDWLYVEDHAKGIMDVLLKGRVGETYNIGGDSERQNIQVVQTICEIMDELNPRENGRGYKELITFVKDRPGHDQRYAIDHGKITKEMGWEPKVSFEEGIRKTVEWYLANQDWLFKISEEKYDGKRLGLK